MRGIIPQKIKGFRDIDPQLNNLRWHVIGKAAKVYKNYGFEHWDTPVLEYADSLGKYLPDVDTVDEGVYSFRNPESEPIHDTKGNRMVDEEGNFLMENHFLSLRYDLTAPLSRVYAEKLWTPAVRNNPNNFRPTLFRRYQYGPVYRFETKLDPGRFREFWQLDFDTVGTSDMTTDAEVPMILSDALEAIGLKRNTYRVKVNNRKVLKGFLIGLGITDEALEQSVLRIVDKADKIGQDGMIYELGKGRKDSSGAVIPGLGLAEAIISSIVDFLQGAPSSSSRKSIIDSLSNSPLMNPVFEEGLKELASIDELLAKLGYTEDRVIIEPSLVRGMAYYTGPVFEVESLQSFIDEKGLEKRVGSICGGGRYDGLVSRLLGLAVPAVGASIGVDRLCELLVQTKTLSLSYSGPVIVLVFDPAMMYEYQKIAQELRANDIAVEVYYGMQKNLKKQLAYADQSNCSAAVLVGEDELKKGVVTLRNLKLGAEMASSITDKAEWKEKVQIEVPREEMVQKLREMLNAQ